MGLEKTIANLKPKTVKLFDNIISILLIVTLVCALLIFIGGYLDKPISFFGDSVFISAFIICLFLGIGYKLLHGGTLHFPEQSKKTEINIPDVWGVKKYKKTPISKPHQRQRSSQPRQRSHKSRGSWNCPKCDFLNVGTTTCKKCNYKK